MSNRVRDAPVLRSSVTFFSVMCQSKDMKISISKSRKDTKSVLCSMWQLALWPYKSVEKDLNVTVFYESLCVDSINFFENQFSKNWKPFLEYINIELVPYGKANQSMDEEGHWTFRCQHDEDECYGNRIQACAISMMHETRPKQLLHFISCYMSYRDQKKEGPKCARKYNVNFQRLKDCANSEEGFNLLATLGDRTHKFNLSFIPTIVFNDVYNEADNVEANNNLKAALCRKLDKKPKICHY